MIDFLPIGEPRFLGWLWVVAAEARPPRGRRRVGPTRERLLEAFDPASADADGPLLARPQFDGDGGVQVVARHGRGVVEWGRWLSETFHPAPWTLGLGFGGVTATKDAAGVVSLGGEALQRARAALWEARRQRRRALVRGVDGAEEQALSALFELQAELRRGWTARQAEIVRLARRSKGRDVAARLGVGPSVVSESLTAASFRPLLRAEDAAAELCDCFGSEAASLVERVRYPAVTESAAPTRKRAARA